MMQEKKNLSIDIATAAATPAITQDHPMRRACRKVFNHSVVVVVDHCWLKQGDWLVVYVATMLQHLTWIHLYQVDVDQLAPLSVHNPYSRRRDDAAHHPASFVREPASFVDARAGAIEQSRLQGTGRRGSPRSNPSGTIAPP